MCHLRLKDHVQGKPEKVPGLNILVSWGFLSNFYVLLWLCGFSLGTPVFFQSNGKLVRLDCDSELTMPMDVNVWLSFCHIRQQTTLTQLLLLRAASALLFLTQWHLHIKKVCSKLKLSLKPKMEPWCCAAFPSLHTLFTESVTYLR